MNWKGGVGGGEGVGGEVALIHCNTDQIQCSDLSLKATDLQITSMTAALFCTKLENKQNSWSSAVRIQPAALGYRAGAAPQLQPQLWLGTTHPGRAGGHPRPRGSACILRAQDSPGATRGVQRAGWRCGCPGTPSIPTPAASRTLQRRCLQSPGGPGPPRPRGAAGSRCHLAVPLSPGTAGAARYRRVWRRWSRCYSRPCHIPTAAEPERSPESALFFLSLFLSLPALFLSLSSLPLPRVCVSPSNAPCLSLSLSSSLCFSAPDFSFSLLLCISLPCPVLVRLCPSRVPAPHPRPIPP